MNEYVAVYFESIHLLGLALLSAQNSYFMPPNCCLESKEIKSNYLHIYLCKLGNNRYS